tara:strand:+ start:84 stop:827 length:744 start_codon:yes stop_codon:yes gene_type:complete
VIEAHNLSKSFRDSKRGLVNAVNGVSFNCQPGQIFGLLGANGAGKTTTLRMLATLLQPTRGSAKLANYDVVKASEKVRQNIGYLSNSTALYGRLSAREMIEYFGRLNSIPEKKLQGRIDELIQRLEITDFQHGHCDKLSTGQKQRVSIARSIVHAPPVMIFDEPTSGLDIMTSQTIMTFIEQCRSDGLTVLFSTHIMSEVERLCDEIAIIHHGRVVSTGTVDSLRESTGEHALENAFLNIVKGANNA